MKTQVKTQIHEYIPITIEVKVPKVKTVKARVIHVYNYTKDYPVHWSSTSHEVYIVPKDFAEKFYRSNQKVRSRLLKQLEPNFPEILVSCESYDRDPEYETYCDYIVPNNLIEEMKKSNLVILVVSEYNGWDGSSISAKILTPEELEKIPEKEVILPGDW